MAGSVQLRKRVPANRGTPYYFTFTKLDKDTPEPVAPKPNQKTTNVWQISSICIVLTGIAVYCVTAFVAYLIKAIFCFLLVVGIVLAFRYVSPVSPRKQRDI